MKFLLPFRQALLSIFIIGAMQTVSAQQPEQVQELETIVVTAQAEEEKKVAETVKTAKQLSREMVNDSRDLVRYETGISVVETGRMGNSGYTIRGVDENRVAITVDGLHQAETLSSQGFKELFEGYGNFNNTRNSVEIEHLKQATIYKGADSVKVGSGALGGSVLFQTKDARDFLEEKDYHVSHKVGYATANNQLLNSLTLAGRYKGFDALVIGTKRSGHEVENYGYKSFDPFVQGREREKADPYEIKKESVLTKLSFSPNDQHRFTLMGDISESTSKGHDFSYTLNASDYYNREETNLRHTDDMSKRELFGFQYENTTSTPLWDKLKFSISKQKINNRARTDDYCEGNEKCNAISNPLGWQVKDGKVVDKNGNLPTVGVEGYSSTVSINGEKVDSAHYSLNTRMNQYWFDCSVFDCNGSIMGYKRGYDDNWNTVYTPTVYTFDPSKIITDHNGKKYARPNDVGYSDFLLTPTGNGFLERSYKKRDLTTETKQLDLALEKQAYLGKTDHQLEYGASYAKTEKSMVNQEGYFAYLPQWWANGFIGLRKDGVSLYDNCAQAKDLNVDKWHSRNTNSYACPSDSPLTSFLIPVETQNGAFYFNDKFRINDYLSFNLGYRYDRIKYKPKYVAGESPAIPNDMVAGLFIPLPTATHGSKPNWWDYDSPSDPKYLTALEEWNKAETEYQAQVANNPAENIAYFSQPKKYSAHSYSLETAIDPTDFLRIQAKYSRGFRTPTTDEMYFTFKHPDFTILPNVNLQPEIAKTKELALTLHSDLGFISTSLFQSDYDNFLNLKYLGQKAFKNLYESNVPTLQHQLYQNVNMDTAKIKGFEINSQLNLGELWSPLQGLNVNYKLTQQRGRMEGDIPMNAIQPRTSVFGIGYDHPSDKFGANIYLTHVAKKKAEDTYNMFHEEEGASDSFVKWRSDDYSVLDLSAYVKPTKNLTLQAGIYNLTDRKYLTWESARSIRSFGTSNMINKETGMGINRFYSPERNFKITAEFTF